MISCDLVLLLLVTLVRDAWPNHRERRDIVVHCYHCKSSRQIINDKTTYIKREDVSTSCLLVPVRCHDGARSCVYGKVKVGPRIEFFLSGCTDEAVDHLTCSRGFIPANNRTLLADFCLCPHELCNDHEFQSNMRFDDDDHDSDLKSDQGLDRDQDHDCSHHLQGQVGDHRLDDDLQMENEAEGATFAPNSANRLMNTVSMPANGCMSTYHSASRLRRVTDSTTGAILVIWLVAAIFHFAL